MMVTFEAPGCKLGYSTSKKAKLSTVSTAFLTWKEWKYRALARQERKALHKLQVALLRQPRQEATAHLRALPFAQREYGLCHILEFTDLPCTSELGIRKFT